MDASPFGHLQLQELIGRGGMGGSGLGESLRQALEHVMATGDYRTIATMWGVEKGMINNPVINGATR